MILTPDEIKAIVGECDDAQMERYKRVVIEAVLKAVMEKGWCPHPCAYCYPTVEDCRRCWREYLEAR